MPCHRTYGRLRLGFQHRHGLAVDASVEHLLGQNAGGIEIGKLETFEQLPLLAQQKRLEHKTGFVIQVKFKAVSMLVLGDSATIVA